MNRREFAGLLGGALIAWPFCTRAQQGQKPHRIAFVHSGIPANKLTEAAGPFWVRRFYAELRRLGQIDGANLIVERYSAEGHSERFGALAAEIVGRNPDVIISNQAPLVLALMAATSAIPIVAITGNPIAGGLVANLARPGANLTGVSIDAGAGIVPKRLQILKEAAPSAVRVAYLAATRDEEQRAGEGLVLKLMPVVDDAQIRRAFAEMVEQQIDAVVIGESGSYLAKRDLIAELAALHRLPAVYPFRDFAEAGGLISYGPDEGELGARMADDVHQVLAGAKPGDIPYYQPTKFELVINLKAAKAQGIAIPQLVIAQADEVIE